MGLCAHACVDRVHACVCVYVCLWTDLCMHVCMYVCVYVCTYVCALGEDCACVCVCMYVCMLADLCVFMCVCTCVYACVCVQDPGRRPAVSQGRGRVVTAQPGQRDLTDSLVTCRARGQGSPAAGHQSDHSEVASTRGSRLSLWELGLPAHSPNAVLLGHMGRGHVFLQTHRAGGGDLWWELWSCCGSSGPALLESGSQAEGPFLVGVGRSPAAGSVGWGALGRRSKLPDPSVLGRGLLGRGLRLCAGSSVPSASCPDPLPHQTPDLAVPVRRRRSHAVPQGTPGLLTHNRRACLARGAAAGCPGRAAVALPGLPCLRPTGCELSRGLQGQRSLGLSSPPAS